MSLTESIRETIEIPGPEIRPGDSEAAAERSERPERPTLTCDGCGFTHEAGDGTWIRHDPTDPLWVYECPECGDVHHIGSPVTTA